MTKPAVTELLDLTEQLCAIPSVSGTEARARRLRRAVAARATRVRSRSSGSRTTSWSRTGAGAGQRVVLGGHLDTVPREREPGPEARRHDPARPRRGGHEGRARGPAPPRTRPRHPSGRTRRDARVLRRRRDRRRAQRAPLPVRRAAELVAGDLAILLEPTGGWLEAGCQGTVHVRATFTGKRAHGRGRGWGPTRSTVRRRCSRARGLRGGDGDRRRPRLPRSAAGRARRGGIANNVVPDVLRDRRQSTLSRRRVRSRSRSPSSTSCSATPTSSKS